MTRIVILGSCRYEPYDIVLVPRNLGEKYHNTEEGYQKAAASFYPAIEMSDEVWVYMPEGKIGEHTQRDLDEAIKQGKKVLKVVPMEVSRDE